MAGGWLIKEQNSWFWSSQTGRSSGRSGNKQMKINVVEGKRSSRWGYPSSILVLMIFNVSGRVQVSGHLVLERCWDRAGDRWIDRFLIFSNEGVALVSRGDERVEPKGKALDLLVFVRSNPHLWSRGLNQDRMNKILDPSHWNELPLLGGGGSALKIGWIAPSSGGSSE